jgi:hypothetical protein
MRANCRHSQAAEIVAARFALKSIVRKKEVLDAWLVHVIVGSGDRVRD